MGIRNAVFCLLIALTIALPATVLVEGVSARTSVEFEGVKAPATDAEKRAVLASPTVAIDGKRHSIGFSVLMRSGDRIGNGTFGLIVDAQGNPVVAADGSQFISSANDFSSLIPVGDRLFNVSHFESRCGAMYLTELHQDMRTGKLTPVSTESVDFSDWGGLWVPCAGGDRAGRRLCAFDGLLLLSEHQRLGVHHERDPAPLR